MSYWKIGLATAGLVWILLIGGVLFWNFAPADNHLNAPTAAAAEANDGVPGSNGAARNAALARATRSYVEQNDDAAVALVEGRELAPLPFLNEELERQGAKWRVRSVDGLVAQTYDVS
ncbi:MAG: hypothetical protein KDE55_01895 [Novosphingobium sp.]|nr:hypothetical protein [Novosphingobium sp.]